MGKRCVVANCNSTHKDGTSLFTFPTDPKMRSTWNRQIKTTRADWHHPSPYSCVCSKHFTQDCFQPLSVVSGMFYWFSHLVKHYFRQIGVEEKTVT